MSKTIGIIGGGQLGRMLTISAKQLGFDVQVIDPTPNSPAGQIADNQIIADYKDARAIAQLAKKVDYLTFEIESADDKAMTTAAKQGTPVQPSMATLHIIKDKFLQKQFLRKAGIPVADFLAVKTEQDIVAAAKKFGYPLLLKARMDAYDGRGNALIKSQAGIKEGMEKLAGRELYVEKFVPFVKELAVIAARNTKKQIETYPVTETIHKNNICHIVMAPAPIDEQASRKALRLAKKTLEHLHGAGVFGIEMFLTKTGQVIINEIAPRVHNSGHYTMEACVTSQFEQHIRAVTGLPLGSTELVVPAVVMINILGERKGTAEITGLDKVLQIPNVSVHIYGKAETKLERKMGHITVTAKTINQALRKAKSARTLLSI